MIAYNSVIEYGTRIEAVCCPMDNLISLVTA
jgi:hypothetical protein